MSSKLDSLPSDLRLIADELIEDKFPAPNIIVDEGYKHTFSFENKMVTYKGMETNNMFMISEEFMNMPADEAINKIMKITGIKV